MGPHARDHHHRHLPTMTSLKGNLLTRMHVDETIIITVEDKRTETKRMPCKNSAMSGGSKHKALVFNCITVLICVHKLIFEQYPLQSNH